MEKGHESEAETLAASINDLIEIYGYCHIDYFAQHFLSHYITADFAPHHLSIFDCINRGESGVKRNILAPRGSAKSTCMAVIYPLHRICYKHYDEMMGYDSDNFILILSRTHVMAVSRIKAIKFELEVNDAIQSAFGDFTGQTWGEKEIVTKNGICLKAVGRGGQVRGSLFRNFRPSLIISDDLDDPESVRNPEVREKDQLWFDSDLMRAGSLDGTTNFINIDTVKHAEATANLLRQRAGWQTLFFRAILHPEDLWHPAAEPLWKEWEKIYTNLELTDRESQAQAFYHANKDQMIAGVKELWPEVITYLDVRKEICDMGYYPVLRELQNSTHDPSQSLFDMGTAIRFSLTPDGFLRSDNRLVKWQEIAGVTLFLDWAGGKDIVDNCFAAAVAVAWVPLPGSRQDQTDSIMGGVHGYVIDAHLARVGATEQMRMIFDMIENVRAEIPKRDIKIRLGIEGFVQDTWEAQKQVIERDFRKEREARNLRDCPAIEWLPRLRNKFDRIDALQPLIRNGWLAFKKGLSNEFYKQMSLYPTGDFLDAPDALEGACQLRVSRFESERRANREAARRSNQNYKYRL